METFCLFLLFYLFACFIPKIPVLAFPLSFNQYSYMIARNQLENIDSMNLKETSAKERIVAIYFEKLKSDEFIRTKKHFYGAKPIETEFDSIKKSELFSKLKLLPKGGNLHIHENQFLDRSFFLEMIKNSTEYDILYICDKETKPFCQKNECSCNNYHLTYFKNSPDDNDGWVKVKDSNWSIDWPNRVVAKTTLIGLLNNLDTKISLTDSSERWRVANPIFSIYSDIIKYNKTRFEYLKACLDRSLEENVQLIEFRRSFFKGLYYFDQDGNRVSLSLNYEIETIEKFKNNYIANNPNFIDFNYILYGSRWKEKQEIQENVQNVLNLQRQYQHFIRGYDLVGEEDLGHTLLFHSNALIQGHNYSLNSNKSFNYYFHVGETNWPIDLNTSDDDKATENNVFDAILFQTKRIGHGLAYFKHPNLYPYLKKNKIAIETCPASNQILGFVPDLRNHPAINFYRSGIPIVLAGDDPGSFGYNDLTIDYYLAFMSWGLSLYDLRAIANNSIEYSSIVDSVKLIGYEKFSRHWTKQIDYFYGQICNNITKSTLNFTFSLMGPPYGPIYSNQIIIYGDGFENMLCRAVSCYFNKTETKGYLKKSNQIACSTPFGYKSNDLTYISIKFGDFKISTGLNYTFISDNILNLDFYYSKSFTKCSNILFIFQLLMFSTYFIII